MKVIASLALAGVLMATGVGVAPGATAVTADDGAAVVTEQSVDARTVDLQVSSPALGFTAPVRLILPHDWASRPTATWPVLYLLHGCCEDQDYRSWNHFTDIEQFMADRDVLVVMPSDGMDGLYSDWWNFGMTSKPGWETFHTAELEQILRRGVRAGDTQAVAGLSIGGYGAMAYAARHPGLFRAAASYSGLPDTTLPGVAQLIQGILIREHSDPLALWGDVGLNLPVWSTHNPTAMVNALRGTALFVSSGDGLPGPLDPAGMLPDPLETATLFSSQIFTTVLALNGILVTTDYYGSGTHNWPYWQREFHLSWPLLARALGVPA